MQGGGEGVMGRRRGWRMGGDGGELERGMIRSGGEMEEVRGIEEEWQCVEGGVREV